MERFEEAIGEADREHIRKILDGAPRRGMADRVKDFLAKQSFLDKKSLKNFRELKQAEREQVISEFIWRVTCHLDGSHTRVAGVESYELGSGFAAVRSEGEGQDRFCLTVKA